MSTTKDTTKDSTDTYVRSSDTDKGKSSTDKSHDTTESTYNKSGTSSYGTSTQQQTRQQQQQGGVQFGQLETDTSGQQWNKQQQQQGGYGGHSQQEVQRKLKEVGHLLQQAGALLQDLQVGSGEICSSTRGGQSGIYQGFGGESQPHWEQRGQRWQQSGPSSGYSQQTGGRWEDREDRLYGRGGYSARDQDRFSSEYRGGSSSDRFGGFGGPNRPDIAYGAQYGPEHRGGRQEWGHGHGQEFGGRSDRW